MKKKLIAFISSLAILITSCVSVSAETPDLSTKDNGIITPYYTYTCDASAGIRKISNTCVQGTSTFSIADSQYVVTLYCILQDLCDGTWVDGIQYYQTFSGIGEHAMSKIFLGLSSGTAYRIHTLVEVKNSSGRILELVNVYSTSEYMQ